MKAFIVSLWLSLLLRFIRQFPIEICFHFYLKSTSNCFTFSYPFAGVSGTVWYSLVGAMYPSIFHSDTISSFSISTSTFIWIYKYFSFIPGCKFVQLTFLMLNWERHLTFIICVNRNLKSFHQFQDLFSFSLRCSIRSSSSTN